MDAAHIQKFAVHWHDASKSHDSSEEIAGSLFVDGFHCRSVFSKAGQRSPLCGRLLHHRNAPVKLENQVKVMSRMNTSATTSRYLTFGRVSLTGTSHDAGGL